MTTRTILSIAFLIVAGGCSDPTRGAAAASATGIAYKVISVDRIRRIKCSYEIVLEQKISEDDLRALANSIRAQEGREYDRFFIGYYLPGMKPGAGGWATTHFDPTLEVKILGLTIDQETELRARLKGKQADGAWIDQGLGTRALLLRHTDAGFFMDWYSPDSPVLTYELSVHERYGQARYIIKDNDFGEYYTIAGNGDLAIWDTEGLIQTLKPLDP